MLLAVLQDKAAGTMSAREMGEWVVGAMWALRNPPGDLLEHGCQTAMVAVKHKGAILPKIWEEIGPEWEERKRRHRCEQERERLRSLPPPPPPLPPDPALAWPEDTDEKRRAAILIYHSEGFRSHMLRPGERIEGGRVVLDLNDTERREIAGK